MSTLRWSPAVNTQPVGGVALAIHGLNYDPYRMQPVVDCLISRGIDSLTLSLHGHGENYQPLPNLAPDAARLCSFSRVTFDLWRDEAEAAYGVARARAEALGVPLLLTGYSLGGLIGCALAATRPDVRVDRLLLFAPALAVPPRGFLPWLADQAPRWVLPSIAPVRYRANRGTPGAAYAALYAGIAALHHADLQRLNVPALVFVDPMDEAISYSGVHAISEQLPAWTLLPVRKSDGVNGRMFHHLVIGEMAVGEGAWRDITQRIGEFVADGDLAADTIPDGQVG